MGSNPARAAKADPQLSRHIDQLYPTLEQLVGAADAARSLSGHPGWGVILELVEAEIATIDRDLDSGRVLDSRADYAAKHGRRGGLKALREFGQVLADRAESRLAEQRAKHEGDAESSRGRD